jgi:hypothetical protein
MPYISTASPARSVTSLKGSVAIVAVELQRAALALVAGPIHAVDQQNVEPAVVVVIEERAARAQVSGRYLAPNAPLLWWKSMPAAPVTSVSEKPSGGGAAARSGRLKQASAPPRKRRRFT